MRNREVPLILFISRGVFILSGDINGDSDFKDLLGYFMNPIVFDLGGIRKIDSLGAKKWISLLGKMHDRRIVLKNCSVSVVQQINMFPEFKGEASIQSFIIPMRCPACDEERDVLELTRVVTQAGYFDDLESRYFCTDCEQLLQCDEDPAEYFNFLVET